MLYDPKWETTVTPIKPIEPWQQLLIDAADIIEKRGWIQNSYENSAGYCTLGAIRAAADAQGMWDHGPYALSQQKMAQAIGREIAGWNDSPFRSKRQVVQMLRYVAGTESSPDAPPRKYEGIVVDSSSWTGRY